MKGSIYTRTGDKGETSLADGTRVPKDALRVEAYGTIDECNSWVGVALSCTDYPLLRESLGFLQHRLFNCSSNIAAPKRAKGVPRVSKADIEYLEQTIDRFEHKSGPIENFILPAGGLCSSHLHVARTVCRRAERRLVTLSATERIDKLVLQFINRASDFLFAAARYSNFSRCQKEIIWDPKFKRPSLNPSF